MVRVFAGSNFYLIKSNIRRIKDDFIAQNGNMSVEEIDCEEIEAEYMLNALRSSSLFSENKLVIARNIAQNKRLGERIEEIFEASDGASELVIVEKDIDKRGSYYKFLKKSSDFIQCEELDEQQMTAWLVDEAKNIGANLTRREAGYLIRRVGLNQQLLHNELQKLAAYAQDITTENIEKLTSETPASSIFNLLDAAFAGESETALRIYEEQKSLGSAPQSILGMFIWQANIVATVAAGSRIPSAELSRKTGIKPFSINKADNIYRRIGQSGVDELLNKLVQIDRQMKTRSADPDELLKNMLMSIS